MKGLGFVFIIIFLVIAWNRPANASTTDHTNAYCAGYASAMAKTYRLQHYYKMGTFYQYSTSSDNLLAEYYQSGSEVVKPNVSIEHNLVPACEDGFNLKGK